MPGRDSVDETNAADTVELCKLIWQFRDLGWRKCDMGNALVDAASEL